MKKSFLLLAFVSFALVFSSCRSISKNELYEIEPTAGNKLPALEIIELGSNNGGSVFWTPGQKVTPKGGDFSTILYKVVEEDISSPTGRTLGYLEVSRDSSWWKNFMWTIPSSLSLMSINLFGFPIVSLVAECSVNVRVLNNKGQFIKRYTAFAELTKYCALWWGVAETYGNGYATEKLAFKMAMKDIAAQIKRDQAYLVQKLQ